MTRYPGNAPSLTKLCPTCGGDRGEHVPGYAACKRKRPMSACDGDCAGCGGWTDCETCGGKGSVPNPLALCANCFDMAGEVVMRTAPDGLCDACRDAIRGVA